MKTLVKANMSEGDWVSGKSVNDEKIRGFIESLNHPNRTVMVRVTQCDNEQSIGRVIETPKRLVEVLPLEKFNEEGQILNLIDFALLIKDEGWFMELTSGLKEIQLLKNSRMTRKMVDIQ